MLVVGDAEPRKKQNSRRRTVLRRLMQVPLVNRKS
jgi:hypothetical protein